MSSRFHVLIVTLSAATSAFAGSPDALSAVRDLKVDVSTKVDLGSARALTNLGARTIDVVAPPAAVLPISPMIPAVTRIGPPLVATPIVMPDAARSVALPEVLKPIAAPARFDGAISSQLGAITTRAPAKDSSTSRPLTVPIASEGPAPEAGAVDTNPFLRGVQAPTGDGPFPPPEVADAVDAVVNNAHLIEASAVAVQNGQVLLVGDKRAMAHAGRALDDVADDEGMQAELVDDEDADLESEGSTPHR